MRRRLPLGICGLLTGISMVGADRVPVFSPKLARPNSRPCLVDEDGGGGFSICEAVGARDWRMEYVRCILVERVVVVEDQTG